jgi:hypothetical protein
VGDKFDRAITPAKGNVWMVSLPIADPCDQIGHLYRAGKSLKFKLTADITTARRQSPVAVQFCQPLLFRV